MILKVQLNVGKSLLKKIRQRFRITYSEFVSSHDGIKSHKLFDRWTTSDAVSKKVSDVRLLLLGTLRCLGRAHAFDDVNESTCISGDINRVFFLHSLSMEALSHVKNMFCIH